MGCGSSKIQATGPAALPSKNNKSLRNAQRLAAQEVYKWKSTEGRPGMLDGFPESEHFPCSVNMDHNLSFAEGIKNGILAQFARVMDPVDEVSDYSKFFATMNRSHISRTWLRDEVFANQRLFGINTMMLYKVDEKGIPAKFGVQQEHVTHLLDAPETLTSLQEQGRLFMMDFEVMGDITAKDGFYVAAPLCLFYLNPDGQLMPLAIQLTQDPGYGEIITPPAKNSGWLKGYLQSPRALTWVYARMMVQNAEGHLHQFHTHLAMTHFIAEACLVSLRRNLHTSHPLYHLMEAFYINTIAINRKAMSESGILAKDGVIHNMFSSGLDPAFVILSRAMESFDWTHHSVHADIKRRGLENIPNFMYRDDALAHEQLLKRFVCSLLDGYYANDVEVANDWEVQAFVEELADPTKGNISGFPKSVPTKHELSEVVVQILLIPTVFHAAANSPQYDVGAYVPNYPLNLRYPPPKRGDEIVDETMLIKAMPTQNEAVTQIVFSNFLSQEADTKLGYLSEATGKPYPDPFFETCVIQYQDDLGRLSEDIRARNEKDVDYAYPYLDPEVMANSIAV